MVEAEAVREAALVIRSIVLALALLGGLFVGAGTNAAQAASRAPQPAAGAHVKGQPFTVRGDIGPNVKRTVTLRVWRGHGWKKIATAKTDKRGTYKFTIQTMASKLKVRVVAPKVRIKGRTYPRVMSRYRVLHTKKQTATVDVPVVVPVGEDTSVRVISDPWIPGRSVALQEKSGATWVTIGTAVLGKTDRFTYRPTTTGTTQLRVLSMSSGAIPEFAGDPVTLTVAADSHDVATQVDAGYAHSCALTSGGDVKCWGSNRDYQLGAGAAIGRYRETSFPSKVVGLPSAAVSIAAGASHTCAVLEDHTLWCWGFNGYGQLGDRTETSRGTAVSVKGLSNVIAVTAGASTTCAIVGATPNATSGAAKCWGITDYGTMGSGKPKSEAQLIPTDVTGLSSGVVSISMGEEHGCAVTTAGAVKCWGNGSSGQLGNGETKLSWVPVAVKNLTNATTVESGLQASCATTSAGPVWCWGGNLAYTTKDNYSVPTSVPGLTGEISGLAVGNIACLIEDGGAKCWGDNGSGQLGDGTTTKRKVPTAVVGLGSGVTSVGTDFDWQVTQSCATLASGQVWCWGSATGDTHTPQRVRDFG